MKGKNITIFGMAKSGIAAARRLASLGARVTITESRSAKELDQNLIHELEGIGVNFELGGHTDRSILNAEMIVVSPGVHLDMPILEKAAGKGIPIISEIELAYQLLSKPIIAITGTNGKTTTTTLIGEMLKAGGKKAAVGGNIGAPLAAIDDRELDYNVAEVSSYQLETIKTFKPWISLILNIQPDHLERHHSMENYTAQKARIFMNQTGDDYLVYNLDDPRVVEMVKPAKAKKIGFSKEQAGIITLPPAEIKIPGKHNLENALAAAQTAYLCGVSKETVAEVLKTFPGVEHRIEFVRSVNGVSFYNDSKATNPDSTMVALDTFKGKGLVLILGGRDKGVSLEEMCKKIKDGVKEVLLIGEAAERFREALVKTGYNNIHPAGSMDEAVKKSFQLSKKGDHVLLSPACASFDMFSDYEDRGRKFKQIVQQL